MVQYGKIQEKYRFSEENPSNRNFLIDNLYLLKGSG